MGQINELLEHLHCSQQTLDQEKESEADVRRRSQLLVTGFQDREMRYRADIAAAQNVLLEYAKEQKELRAIMDRQSEEMRLLREAYGETKRSADANMRFQELEDARTKTDLAEIVSERKELAERLESLQKQIADKDKENTELRARAELLRTGVVLHSTREVLGA